MRHAMLALLLGVVACAPVQVPPPVVNYVPVPQPAPAAPQPAPTMPQAESPPLWHFYNASTGRCEPIARINLTRALTANNVAGCRDLIPNVERAFVIVCPATGTSGPTVQVFGVSETECEQAQAAAETAGVASGRAAGTSQPRTPARYSF
jgi:hypothetical protein